MLCQTNGVTNSLILQLGGLLADLARSCNELTNCEYKTHFAELNSGLNEWYLGEFRRELASCCLSDDSPVPCSELSGAHCVRSNLLDSSVMARTLA